MWSCFIKKLIKLNNLRLILKRKLLLITCLKIKLVSNVINLRNIVNELIIKY